MLTVVLLVVTLGSKDYPQLISNIKLISRHTACLITTRHRCKKR